MSLHGARTPREGHPGFDGVVVLGEPLGQAPHGPQRPASGALQPRIELRRLPLAHQGGKVLRARHRLVHRGMGRAPLGERRGLVFWARLRASEYQPGRPARGQGLVWRPGHDRQRLPRTAWSGGQAPGLTQPAGIGGDEAIAPGVALPLEVAKEPHGGVAARVPTLQQGGFGRVPETGAPGTPRLASRAGGRPEIPLDGARTHPDLPRHRGDGPPLAVHGPAPVPSDPGTGGWRRAALTAARAWPWLVNTGSSAAATFWRR